MLRIAVNDGGCQIGGDGSPHHPPLPLTVGLEMMGIRGCPAQGETLTVAHHPVGLVDQALPQAIDDRRSAARDVTDRQAFDFIRPHGPGLRACGATAAYRSRAASGTRRTPAW